MRFQTDRLKMMFIVFLISGVTFELSAEAPVVGKYSDLGSALSEFAARNSGRANITADMGLNWSEAYIGELISFPPHYGFGGSVALNSFGANFMNSFLVDNLGASEIKPLFAKKIFFPSYVAEMRIGGFRGVPFDIGLKAGFLPSVIPLPLFSDFKYDNFQFGGDLRYNIAKSYYTGFMMSLGFGINYVSGFLELEGYNGVWSESGGAAGGTPSSTVLKSNGSKLRIKWDDVAFNAKLILQKGFRTWGVTFFGGIVGGYGLSSSSLGLIGEGFSWNNTKVADMTGTNMQEVQDKLNSIVGSESQWMVSNSLGEFGLTGKVTANAVDFHCYEGIAFDLDNDWHIQLALVMDFISLEYGFVLGFRWQQKRL
ncbi:MAG: hypothetical protein LBD07_04815 [Spirochaetaceae bacterium]|jgi:hypothetical protein|nr:hypothetical protein [Spirochaetaceae bacterium]